MFRLPRIHHVKYQSGGQLTIRAYSHIPFFIALEPGSGLETCPTSMTAVASGEGRLATTIQRLPMGTKRSPFVVQNRGAVGHFSRSDGCKGCRINET
jgi:hypothetical protein